MRQRVPSARLAARGSLRGWDLRFHKRSWKDGSGKCNIVRRAGATLYCVIYELDPAEKLFLDTAEGLGNGYRLGEMTVAVDAVRLTAFTYLAAESHIDDSLEPFSWYRDLVVAGAREHGFPAERVRRLERVSARSDPDRSRDARERRWLDSELARV